MPTLEAWGTTDPGAVRQNNEDAWLLDPALCLAIVADGMGGASCGEVASALAVEIVGNYVRKPPVPWPPAQLLEEAIQEANRCVLERANRDESCSGMGSTIVAALWELPRMTIANVGDSRAYLWRAGALSQLSYDQTLVNELRLRFGLTEEEVSNFPHRNVLTMAVGTTPNLLVRIHEETLTPGDQVLLCSDGLSGPMGDGEIANVLSRLAPIPELVGQLIEGAKAAGGPDNITAVLLRYSE
jgi:serine/threonine protein phosphatase PrpC